MPETSDGIDTLKPEPFLIGHPLEALPEKSRIPHLRGGCDAGTYARLLCSIFGIDDLMNNNNNNNNNNDNMHVRVSVD